MQQCFITFYLHVLLHQHAFMGSRILFSRCFAVATWCQKYAFQRLPAFIITLDDNAMEQRLPTDFFFEAFPQE